MQAVQTAATPCKQTAGNNPSQWIHNWSCTWHTPNKGAQHAGHVVGAAAAHSPGGGTVALILIFAVCAVIGWMLASRRRGSAAPAKG